jgi:hypothetical protein
LPTPSTRARPGPKLRLKSLEHQEGRPDLEKGTKVKNGGPKKNEKHQFFLMKSTRLQPNHGGHRPPPLFDY